MRLLAIDTATEACSVALTGDDGAITERYQISPFGHSDQLLPMAAELLGEAGLNLQDLEAVAFDSGPGSFTGIRIGLGVAQGLALGLNLRLIGISSLMVLAEGCSADAVLSAIDARMGQVYWARLKRDSGYAEGWMWCDEPRVSDPSAMPDLSSNEVRIGSGWERYLEVTEGRESSVEERPDTFPRAAWVAVIAGRVLTSSAKSNSLLPYPTYVRNIVTG